MSEETQLAALCSCGRILTPGCSTLCMRCSIELDNEVDRLLKTVSLDDDPQD